ncbi:hypothetical protein BLNAU_1274 [Blattamonas nauphoetae]|uniref:Uncharacterized protein n=1 Tax=Blattamonas nauphoetae TaxID=2049346 RepID=A0ABQ9YFD0_9EUKA|nr:hypothetical protein BLNAU_17424 [Blattamonas nauphoetae]KAK2948207.1 hypothetical protein BLNAU_16826 [Blattamonas nauphoetae]KAK2962424.1 hypothetical protein BLNAU_2667 [Blattamonas nauphoetae]KAK2963708.1 hypothetical protein BLNAU_1274 [Blattamonas nauphoetae]
MRTSYLPNRMTKLDDKSLVSRGRSFLVQIQKVISCKGIVDLHLWRTAKEVTAVEKQVGGAALGSNQELEGD